MMSTAIESSLTGDLAAGSALSVKRENEDAPDGDNSDTHGNKKAKIEEATFASASAVETANASDASETSGLGGKNPTSKAREIRLEQNRKAARESRR